MTTHNTHKSPRFYRRNLPKDHAAILTVAAHNEAKGRYEILAVISAAARFATSPNDIEQFDQMFMCQHGLDPSVHAEMTSIPVDEESHRTTAIFTDNAFTKRIGMMKPGRCWAAILIRGRAPDALRPEIRFEPLDERTWLPTAEMATKFPLPALGDKWPFHDDATSYAEVNPNAWSLMCTAAKAIGGVKASAFPTVEIPTNADLNHIDARASKIRDEREAHRVNRMLESLPAAMRESFLAKLASKV